MKYLLLALAGAVSLTACHSDSEANLGKDVVMHNDFESLVGWVPDAVSLSKEQAHSGVYSLKVDPAHEYSLGYNSLLGQVSATRIRGVRVEAWAFAPEKNSSAQIRIAINATAGGATIMNEGIEFSSQVKEVGKWVKVSKEVTFPANASYTSQLVTYLWGAGGGKAYIDDITMTALQ